MMILDRSSSALRFAAAGCVLLAAASISQGASASTPTADASAARPLTFPAVISTQLGFLLASLEFGQRAYYASPNGRRNGKGTKADPWLSLEKAMEALRPGDTLWVRGGTYEEDVRAMSLTPSTADQPIRVKAFPGERPVLKGLLRLNRPSYWEFDGLNVKWDPDRGQPREHMVKIGDGIGWSFRNAELWGARSYAAMLVFSSRDGEPRNWRLTGCALHDTKTANRANQDHLLYINSGLTGSGGRVDHNLFFDATNGSAIKLGGPSAEEGGASGVTVEYNTIVGARQGVIVSWQSRNNVLRRNLIGRTDAKYAAIRGYQLTESGNVATDNAVFETRQPIVSDSGYTGVRDAGGNRVIDDPRFDAENAGSFRPRNPEAAGYGRYASSDPKR